MKDISLLVRPTQNSHFISTVLLIMKLLKPRLKSFSAISTSGVRTHNISWISHPGSALDISRPRMGH